MAAAPLLRILHEVGCRPSNKQQQQLTQESALSPDRRANVGQSKLFFPSASSVGRNAVVKVAATD